MTHRSIGKNLKTLEEVCGKVPAVIPKRIKIRQSSHQSPDADDNDCRSPLLSPCSSSALSLTSSSALADDTSSKDSNSRSQLINLRCREEQKKSQSVSFKALFGSDVPSSSSSSSEYETLTSATSDIKQSSALRKRRLRAKPPVNYRENKLRVDYALSDNKASNGGKGSKGCQSPSQDVVLPYNTIRSPSLKYVSSKQGAWPEYWDFFLQKSSNRSQVAPVHFFKHAPFADIWKEFATTGLIIEVLNPYARLRNQEAYWIATVREFAGYRALIEYERFGDSTKEFAWIPFCSDVPQPLGFSDKTKKFLRPSPDVAIRYPNFLDAARKILMRKGQRQGLATLQANHAQIVKENIEVTQIYKLGTKLEVIDVNSLARNQAGTVTAVIGDRIHVTYGLPKKTTEYDFGFFLNVKSEHVHLPGWSRIVGHDLYAKDDYSRNPTPTFVYNDVPFSCQDFLEIGLAMEVRNPEFPWQIVPAVVSKVLKAGYFMAKVATNKCVEASKMCFHVTSPYIFQCGFAHSNEIEIPHPDGTTKSSWSWDSYFQLSQCEPFDISSVASRSRSPHLFEEGMKMEAVDLCKSNTIRPVTIVKIAGHLLRLHFDGRPKQLPESYQWMDAESRDIYPLGWAEMVGHKFSGYPEAAIPNEHPVPKIISVRTIGKDEYANSVEKDSDSEAESTSYALLERRALSEILDYEMSNTTR